MRRSVRCARNRRLTTGDEERRCGGSATDDTIQDGLGPNLFDVRASGACAGSLEHGAAVFLLPLCSILLALRAALL